MKSVTDNPNTSWYPSTRAQYKKRGIPSFDKVPDGWVEIKNGEEIKAGDLVSNDFGPGRVYFAAALIGAKVGDEQCGCWSAYRRPKLTIEDLPYPPDDEAEIIIPQCYKLPSTWYRIVKGKIIAGDVIKYSDGSLRFAHGYIDTDVSQVSHEVYRRPLLTVTVTVKDSDAVKSDEALGEPSILKTLPDDVNEIVIGGIRWKKTLKPVWSKE